MANTKNEHVSPKDGGWIVRHEGSKKISRLFEKKKDAVQYAGIIASNDGGLVVTHKYNGQFEDFMHGNQIHVRAHKIVPLITGTIENPRFAREVKNFIANLEGDQESKHSRMSVLEIRHPIVNNIDPIIQTMISV